MKNSPRRLIIPHMPHQYDYNVQTFEALPFVPYQTTQPSNRFDFPFGDILASCWGSPGCGNLAASVYYWCALAFNTHTHTGLLANYDPCKQATPYSCSVILVSSYPPPRCR